jgi:hypothetical protein
MVDWRSTIVPLVIPILTSGLAISGVTFFINEVYFKPNLEIKLLPNELNGDLSTVTVRNIGNVAANNVLLTIQLPNKIISYSIFTTENATLIINPNEKEDVVGYNFFNISTRATNENTGVVELYVPRFVQGNGSLIKVVAFTDPQEDSNNRNYGVYTTYDGGSTWTGVFRMLTFQERINSIWDALVFTLSIVPSIIAYSYFAWTRLFRMRYKKQIRYLTEYMKIIDCTFNILNYDKERCLSRLYDIQKEFTDIFKAGKLPEWQYDLLNGKISSYLSFFENKKDFKRNDIRYIE